MITCKCNYMHVFASSAGRCAAGLPCEVPEPHAAGRWHACCLPERFHRVLAHRAIVGHQRHPFGERLRHEKPIERVVVARWQSGSCIVVTEARNLQLP